jgi:hypothetical protein
MDNLATLKRSQLEEYYVNLYRRAWGSNAGLNSEKISNMPADYLKTCITSLAGFVELTEKKRGL